MSIVAIITARGGSKRIPKKNIKEFYGKPMIVYAIDAALSSGVFDEVMVSTDSLEIGDIAKKYGAKVPFMRSSKTANDYATTYDVLEEVLFEYAKNGKKFDEVCCIYPCVPFLTSDTLKKSYEEFKSKNAVAILPVCKYSSPIEWAMKIEDGYLIPNDSVLMKKRSQDIMPSYFDVGMFYFCKVESLLKEKTLVPNKTIPYIIDESVCQDIDTLEDWKMAEIKFKISNGGV